MADPVIGAITTFNIKRDTLTGGACREYWLRIPGLSGASDNDSTDLPIYYLENPFLKDMVVMNALAVITTVSGNAAEINVGLGNDAVGTGAAAEIFDTLVDSALGVLDGLATQAVDGVARPIWKKPGTATDSFLTVVQGLDVDASALRWNLYLKVIPYDDLIGREGEQAAVTVA